MSCDRPAPSPPSPRSLLAAAPAGAIDVPFDVPWIGYDTAVYPEGIFPYASQSADFNGDGTSISPPCRSAARRGCRCCSATATAGTCPPQTYALQIESMDLAVADFDGDKDIDIVTSDTGRFWEGQSVSLYRNDGTGVFAYAGSWPIGDTGPSGITAADFNGDGWIDVATANDAYIVCNNTVSVLRNNDGNGFVVAQVASISSCTNEIDSGDVDNDGQPGSRHRPREQPLHDHAQQRRRARSPPIPAITGLVVGSIPQDPTVHVADVDRDGWADIFFSNADTGGVGAGATGLWRNDGAGQFRRGRAHVVRLVQPPARSTSTPPTSPATAGPTSSARPGSSGNWFLFESDGGRRLRPAAASCGPGHWPSAIDTPDLDSDGDADVMMLGAGLARGVRLPEPRRRRRSCSPPRSTSPIRPSPPRSRRTSRRATSTPTATRPGRRLPLRLRGVVRHHRAPQQRRRHVRAPRDVRRDHVRGVGASARPRQRRRSRPDLGRERRPIPHALQRRHRRVRPARELDDHRAWPATSSCTT